MIADVEGVVAEMRARVAAILEAAADLRARAGCEGGVEVIADLERVGQAAQEFLALVDRADQGSGPATPHLRHDLYGAVNNMVLYAELVKEDAAALGGLDALIEAVGAVRSLALGLQDLVDRWTRGASGPDPEEVPEEPSSGFMERTRGARILVVDDDEASLGYLSTRLERLGYDVVTATRGLEALDLLEESCFDVVLLDIMMPEVGGDQVLRRLRERIAASAMPVIMVTARDQSADVVSSLRNGASDYVTKPIDFPVLLARIETQLSLRRLTALKEEFCAIATHDLRGLLTTMLMAAQVLERELEPEVASRPPVRRHLQTLRGSCQQMKGIIEDFLGFDAMEHGRLRLEPRDVDLAAVLREAVEAYRAYAGSKRIQMACRVEEPLRVTADATRLGQVVRNLINNAVKFTPQEGLVEVVGRADEGRILIEVLDTGVGLAERDRHRLFRRNARLSAEATDGETGSGLGLYISKRLVEEHGGEIGAENRPQGGSRFWFRI